MSFNQDDDKVKNALRTLREVRKVWPDTPRPNFDIPGFNYENVSKLIERTADLDDLDGLKRYECAESILDQLTVPSFDIDEPPQSSLLLHFRLTTAERALGVIAPKREEIRVNEVRFSSEVNELTAIILELRSAVPRLEQQAEEVKENVQVLKDSMSRANRGQKGWGSVQVGFAGVSISLDTLHEQAEIAYKNVMSLEKTGSLQNIERALSRILEWSRELYLSLAKVTTQTILSELALIVNRIGQRAAGGLTVVKKLIHDTLHRRTELSTKSYKGAFSEDEYAVEYEISGADIEEIEIFINFCKKNTKNPQNIIDTYFLPRPNRGARGIQPLVFASFKLKKETMYIKPKFWRGAFHTQKEVADVVGAVNYLTKRVRDDKDFGRFGAVRAMRVLGFVED